MVKKGNKRLLRRIGNSVDNDFVKISGDDENYIIEYDSIAKIKKQATFVNDNYIGVEQTTRVNNPEAFINRFLNSYLEFEYNYNNNNPNFKWEIEYDLKLTTYYSPDGYTYLMKLNFGPLDHVAFSTMGNGLRRYADSNILTSTTGNLQSAVFDYNVVDKWFKFKFGYEDNKNGQRFAYADFLGIYEEFVGNATTYQLNGVQNIRIFGDGNNNCETMYVKNLKIKYDDNLILDCPDPSTGINLVGVNAIPHNIEKR